MAIGLRVAALAAVMALAGARAQGAEIVLEQSAVQKLVEQGLFKDGGRYYVRRGGCAAYLESPAVSLREGRVFIRTHLSASIGQDVGDGCIGTRLATWATVSGVPVAQGALVRLGGVRLDAIDDPNFQWLIDAGLTPQLPGALELNVLDAARSMLQGPGRSLQAEIQALDIQAVGIADNRLSIRFEFKLLGR